VPVRGTCKGRDTLPAHPKSFDPQYHTNSDRAAEKAQRTQNAAEHYYNRQIQSGSQGKAMMAG